MPMGNPGGYAGENPMAGFWANNVGAGGGGLPPELAKLLEARERQQAKQREQVLALLGLGAALGRMKGGGKQQGKKGVLQGGAPMRSGGGPASGGQAGGQGGQTGMSVSPSGARRNSGAAQRKLDPFTIAAVGSGMAAGGGAATAAGAGAAAGGSLLASPVVGAGITGGATLLDGLINGGGEDEMAKRAMRQQGQQNLFNSIRSLADGLRARNQELRGLLTGLGGR